MFDRYSITSEEDLREALQQTGEHPALGPSNVVAFPKAQGGLE